MERNGGGDVFIHAVDTQPCLSVHGQDCPRRCGRFVGGREDLRWLRPRDVDRGCRQEVIPRRGCVCISASLEMV